jgi:molecular chaperone DnaK
VEVTRDRFQELTHDLLDRTRFTTRQTLKAAGLDWGQIDRVLLVGGSSRMPMVREMLRTLAGKEPDTSVSADEAVAHGAALRAGQLLAQNEGKPARFSIQNVNSHSLGVVGTDSATGRKRNAILIPRNTPLPASATRVFKTKKTRQENVLVQIVEGEAATPDACTAIGQCVIRDLPPDLPAGSPVGVKFKYGTDGRLAVTVQVSPKGKPIRQEITREHAFGRDDLDRWRNVLAGKD